MKTGSKSTFFCLLGLMMLPGFTGHLTAGASTTLPFRSEAGECLFNSAATQTIETNYGLSLTALPFTQTTNYHFYSAPLASAASLLGGDRAGGTIVMKNTATQSSVDFQVSGELAFFDYDPGTGTNTLIVWTPFSGNQKVKHNSTVQCTVPTGTLPGDITIPAGHMLHVVVTVLLASGDPEAYGQLIYEGPAAGATSVALFPQNRAFNWNFGPLAQAPDATITTSATAVAPDTISNTAQVPNTAGATYTWSIANGIITAGQGTPQITWTAGSPGSASLAVTVTKICSSTSGTAVRVMGAAGTMLGVARSTNSSVQVTCSGTPGQVYAIQATTNLSAPNWTTIGTVTAGQNGLFSVMDANGASFPCRFYRSASQ